MTLCGKNILFSSHVKSSCDLLAGNTALFNRYLTISDKKKKKKELDEDQLATTLESFTEPQRKWLKRHSCC